MPFVFGVALSFAQVRMGNMLDIVQRLKNAKSLDPSRTAALDAAYLMCRPPERAPRVVKEVPPLHQYIKKLIFQDLSKANLEKVMRQMRRLPWAECEGYIVKQILKVHKSKFGSMHLLAALTAGMGRVRSSFSITLVDELMEDIRVGLETNEFRHQQRRLAAMRLLGELYSYKVRKGTGGGREKGEGRGDRGRKGEGRREKGEGRRADLRIHDGFRCMFLSACTSCCTA